MTAAFQLDGQDFVALNGGPMYKFSPATSFVVDCDNQAEVDYYWDKLGAGGKHNQCAWLDDQFGVTWQIVPKQLGELLSDPDPAKAGRVMQAMMKMQKIDIAELQRAYDAHDGTRAKSRFEDTRSTFFRQLLKGTPKVLRAHRIHGSNTLQEFWREARDANVS